MEEGSFEDNTSKRSSRSRSLYNTHLSNQSVKDLRLWKKCEAELVALAYSFYVECPSIDLGLVLDRL